MSNSKVLKDAEWFEALSKQDSADQNQESLIFMVKELSETNSDRFTKWEEDFVDSITIWNGNYTEKQAEIIEKLWNKYCDN